MIRRLDQAQSQRSVCSAIADKICGELRMEADIRGECGGDQAGSEESDFCDELRSAVYWLVGLIFGSGSLTGIFSCKSIFLHNTFLIVVFSNYITKIITILDF